MGTESLSQFPRSAPSHAIAGSSQTPPSKLPALPKRRRRRKMRMTRRVSEGGLPPKRPLHTHPPSPQGPLRTARPYRALLTAGPAPPPWPPRAVPGATPVTLRLGRPRGNGLGGRPLRERRAGAWCRHRQSAAARVRRRRRSLRSGETTRPSGPRGWRARPQSGCR